METVESAEDEGYMDFLLEKGNCNPYNKTTQYNLWISYALGYMYGSDDFDEEIVDEV